MKKTIVYLLCLALIVNGEFYSDSDSDEVEIKDAPLAELRAKVTEILSSSARDNGRSTSKTVKVYEHWWYGKSGVIKIKKKKCVNLPKHLDNNNINRYDEKLCYYFC
jgi:hypothetical protein